MAKKNSLDEICEASVRIFAKYGFRRTRVEDIAIELGVATGTLYRYVKDKKDLYEKSVEYGISKWQKKVIEAVSGVENVKEQFITMCTKSYQYLTQDADMHKILIDDPSIFPLSPRKVRFPDIDTASLNMIRNLLIKGIDSGVFRKVNIDQTAELFYSIYVMFIIKTYIKSEGQSTQEMYEEGIDLLLNGLLS
ncbi:TetR/AcrR family transcriptional regulator [bacterium]|nr:TetR/AcrR family transcriptional regulator [bacterium]